MTRRVTSVLVFNRLLNPAKIGRRLTPTGNPYNPEIWHDRNNRYSLPHRRVDLMDSV